MADVSKIGLREKLKPRKGDELYWHRLRPRCSLGFRPSRRGGRGTWFARIRVAEQSTYLRKALGDYGSLLGHDVFNQAKKDAEVWFDQIESGGIAAEKIETVGDACRAYLREKPSQIAAGVFKRHVFYDPLSTVKLEKLRRHHLRD